METLIEIRAKGEQESDRVWRIYAFHLQSVLGGLNSKVTGCRRSDNRYAHIGMCLCGAKFISKYLLSIHQLTYSFQAPLLSS